MKLSNNLTLDPIEYASQGNAILGIRDSGKSYTATSLAEKLMDAGIPIIAFDPIGVWRNLKIGTKGHRGYPIVVAGDNGDLELTVESAPKIVRAAMQHNISLVVDLYSMKLSKADWRRIVQSCVELLLYENKPCGLRHIFLEEAAEFCPQRVGPESGRVYAEIEKLARMGGNASLGYTLINQRAEEVNKAVLELCDCLFLHRQKGRHSLTALGKWLDVAEAENSKGIIQSLPGLRQGACWVWQQGSRKPVFVDVLPKNTFHPDRRNPLVTHAKGAVSDVSAFVATMVASLRSEAVVASKADLFKDGAKVLDKIVPKLEKEMKAMETKNQEIEKLKSDLRAERAKNQALEKTILELRKAFKPQFDILQKVFGKTQGVGETQESGQYQPFLSKLHGKNKDMLQVLIDGGPMTRQQLAFRAGLSANSGTFGVYLGRLNSLGLTEKVGDQIRLRQ